MHADLKHAQRGQAIAETVIFLPLFLIALFGVIWSVQAAVQSERVESAVRYAGLVSQGANPYLDYSLYSLYKQLGSSTMPATVTTPCLPLTDALSDAAPTYTSPSATVTASTPFWSPANIPTPSCGAPGIVGQSAGNGLNADLLLSQQTPTVTSTIAAPAQLKALSALTSTQASERFFKPVGVNVILACYPTLNTQINASLNIGTDTSLATLPVALPDAVVPVPLVPKSSCTTGF